MKVKDILIRQRQNDNIAVCYKDKKIAYGRLYERVKKHSNRIRNIKHNRNVGIFFHNSIDYTTLQVFTDNHIYA